MNIVNPFPKLFATTAVHPDNLAILNELGAYLTSVALIKPRPKDERGKLVTYFIGEHPDQQEA